MISYCLLLTMLYIDNLVLFYRTVLRYVLYSVALLHETSL